jgi:N-acetylglucosaminyl-diphospho-decaprenol L-rhamnosyltransferase
MIERPLVSVVLLSYNRPYALERALASVSAETRGRYEVIVVDNRSASSGRIAEIVASHRGVRLVALEQNVGFTGGMNRGIAAAAGEYVYLTEDDIALEAGCVGALVDHLERHPGVALAGPVMLNRGDGRIRCAGGHFDLGGTFEMRILGAGEPAASAGRDPYEVMYLPGASILGRAAVFRELRGFRDEFFMYVEDVELCARVLARGWSIAIVPGARVVHDDPPAAEVAGLEFHKLKNLLALYFIHARLRVLPEFVCRYGALAALRAMAAGRARVHLDAWAWALSRAPRFLAERFATS